MTRRILGPGPVAFLAIWLLLLAGGRTRFFHDPDTFWHTVVGRTIIDTGYFFDRDPFSGSHAGDKWIPHQWLGEVAMGLLDRVGGFDALLLASVTILAGTFAPLFARLVRAGLHWLPAAMLTGLALAAAAGHFHVRPHLVTLAGFAFLFTRLADFDTGRIQFQKLLWLIPVFLVWSNTHGGALGGLATFALALGGWAAARLLGWPSPIRTLGDTLKLLGLFGLLCATPFVNPYGPDLPRCWFEILRMGELKTIIQEHAALDVRSPAAWPILAFAAVYVLALLGTRQRPRATWLIPLVWLALGIECIRHSSIFAVTALVALADVIPATTWARRLIESESDLFRRAGSADPCGISSLILPLVAVLTAIGLQSAGVRVPVIGRGWAGLDPTVWPVDMIETLNREAAGRNGIRTFNEYADGGFLIYFAPQYRPFVDGRCELFGGPWLKAFVEAESGDVGAYLKVMEGQYGRFEAALTRTGSGFDSCFRTAAEWTLVRETPTASFYRRKADSAVR
ncbi:MAG TPA: hypothetical protein VGJ05_20075 [Fimbriiglobus sp.]|jgi:hypothetical protein